MHSYVDRLLSSVFRLPNPCLLAIENSGALFLLVVLLRSGSLYKSGAADWRPLASLRLAEARLRLSSEWS
jgi:hypothetical protein